MVAVMQPTLADVIQDPAAGTGGFLIAANRYIREHGTTSMAHRGRSSASTARGTFFGMEHVQDTHRLALMNLMLHGLDSDPNGAGIRYGDTLSPKARRCPRPR
jgi:type I restriction enzyme M protein